MEHLEEEKLAAAIQQGAGRKVIEAVRAEKSVQMKSVLAELNMEQFRRVPLYESYMADEITKEQYRAELLDYEEAHRKLNEQLTTIMEDTLVWERALSLRNPWIQLVKSLVQKIEVSADKRIRIVFGFQDVFTELGKESAET